MGSIGVMSGRARMATRTAGERVLGDWDAASLHGAVESACGRLGCRFDEPLFSQLPLGFARRSLLKMSSRHHVGSALTGFYSVDPVSIAELFAPGDAAAAARASEMEAEQKAAQDAIAYGDDVRAESDAGKDEIRRGLRARYEAEHGFAPNSVAAFMEERPGECSFGFNREGQRTVSVPVGSRGKRFCCPVSSASEKFVVGYDATAGEFERAARELDLERDAAWLAGGRDVDVREAAAILAEVRESWLRAYGFPSNSVRAYREVFPGRVREYAGADGKARLRVEMKSGGFSCPAARQCETVVRGFDAQRRRFRERLDGLSW